jgi:hypothetical protein
VQEAERIAPKYVRRDSVTGLQQRVDNLVQMLLWHASERTHHAQCGNYVADNIRPFLVWRGSVGMLSDTTYNSGVALATRFVLKDVL